MKLKFAPLIRVSTETQEKQGESLRTQKKQIQGYVKNLNGVIPESCWQYSGQESATEGHERKKLEQLLTDSAKGIFDAVIVVDVSRWSRDNAQSKAGLEIFRENGIRFFSGTSEFDLYNPQSILFLGMSAEIGEFFARQGTQKSLLNRIERAKRNIPSSGKLPFGRLYDKTKNEWGIDEKKQKDLQWAANQYLEGESLQKIGKTLNMNFTNLWRILNHRSGVEWTIHFKSDKLNIDEFVKIKIPRLLPQETIEQIHQKSESNKTFTHGHIKHQYLLARTVFCSHCGYAMYGQTNNGSGIRYYRHARHRKIECDIGFWVPASDLEDAIMTHLFKIYGDIDEMQKSMLRAIPDNSKVEKLRDQKQAFGNELEKVEGKLQRVIESIADDLISTDEAKKVIEKIREREILLKGEIEKIRPQVENIPTKEQIHRRAKLIRRQLEVVYFRPGRLKKMTFDNKRKIIQTAFGGKDSEGARHGVYLSKPEKAGGPVTYEIKGIFEDVQGQLSKKKEKENSLTNR
ncbi:MAG TPA: hypothetical protein ENI07_08800 [Desulfobacterales bacterium]|nr:hypothetical protein [Desulfobacterales bacterium]